MRRQHYADTDADTDADADTNTNTNTDAVTHPDADPKLFIPNLERRSELQLGHRSEVPG